MNFAAIALSVASQRVFIFVLYTASYTRLESRRSSTDNKHRSKVTFGFLEAATYKLVICYIQDDSKLLSGFPRPIIFKSETTQ
jgi:hypothetical protein